MQFDHKKLLLLIVLVTLHTNSLSLFTTDSVQRKGVMDCNHPVYLSGVLPGMFTH